jgi:peroxiredoxin
MAARRLLPIVVVAAAGTAAAAVSIAVLADDPVDGEFALDEPGIFQEPSDDVNPELAGATLPDVVLSDADGRPVSLATYRGAPLVVNFWFSRCAPCRRELRDFATVHAEVGETVRFVGVDPFDTASAMESFAAERGVGYDLLRDVGEHSGDVLLSDELGIVGYPVTLFVDGDGRILRQTGEIDADELRTAIGELF